MLKIKTITALFAAFSVGALVAAADCSGGNTVACEEDADCADQEENTVCDDSLKICVRPNDPVCANDLDCDLLADTGEFLVKPANEDCSNCADGAICVESGVGQLWCAFEENENGIPDCEDPDVGGIAVQVDGRTICVRDSGKICSEDGQCG